jgi:hypothetical protein
MYVEILLALLSAKAIEWLLIAAVKTYPPQILKRKTKANGVPE